MKKEMLVIVPSRGRQKNVQEFYDCFIENSEISDLCLGLDDDEFETYPKLDNVIYDINPNMRLCPKLNILATKYAKRYEYICFTGDDVRIKTKGWDKALVEPLRNKVGISYGNDLLMGKSLPNTIVINSSIVNALGWMVPPVLDHFYMDNFYLDTGNKLEIINYFPDIILEHLHWINKKAQLDKTYVAANTMDKDYQAYSAYLANDWEKDLEKIRQII